MRGLPGSRSIDAFELKKAIALLLLPPGGPLVLVLIGLAVAVHGLRTPLGPGARPGERGRSAAGGRGPDSLRIGVAIAAAGAVLAWLMATPAIGSHLMRIVESDLVPMDAARWRAVAAGPSPPQAIVALGGGSRRERLGEETADRALAPTVERTLHAARIARLTGLPLLVSGGVLPRRQSAEGELMRRLLEDDLGLGVRWVEAESLDTAQNAQHSAARLRDAGIASAVLVTHAYHMPRAQRAFRDAGIGVVAAPFGFVGGTFGDHWHDWLPSASGAMTSQLALHELAGRWWYRLARDD